MIIYTVEASYLTKQKVRNVFTRLAFNVFHHLKATVPQKTLSLSGIKAAPNLVPPNCV